MKGTKPSSRNRVYTKKDWDRLSQLYDFIMEDKEPLDDMLRLKLSIKMPQEISLASENKRLTREVHLLQNQVSSLKAKLHHARQEIQ